MPCMSDDARIGALEYQVHQLQDQVKALTKRLAELERRSPTPSSGGDGKDMPTAISSKVR